MNDMLTERNLGVFWDGDEVDGVLCYGLWRDHIAAEPLFPRVVWPQHTECRPWHLAGDGWIILLWTIRMAKWPLPGEWESTLRRTLQCFHDQGAVIGWCGIEGRFVEPPLLFEPDEMSGGVYAASTADGWFRCAARLGSRFEALSDEDLRLLNELMLRTLPAL